MAHVLGAKFKRIQFTPDTTPDEITGRNTVKMGEQVFMPGVVFTNVLLADEINRTPPRTQAALLEAMQERTVTVEGKTHQLPDPFLVIATQNPFEHEGIFPLPESQLDRFLFKIILDYADAESEIEMLRLPHTGVTPDMLGDIQSLLGVVGLDRARADLDLTTVPADVATLHRRNRAAHAREPRPRARRELPRSDPPAQCLEGTGAPRRPRPRHDRRRPRCRTVRAAPPPDLPRGHERRTTRSRPRSTARPLPRARRTQRPARNFSGERLHERPLREHAREVHPELGRGRGVARRLGALGRVGCRGGGRVAARDRILDRRRPDRRAAHVRERDRGRDAEPLSRLMTRRRRPSPNPAPDGCT